MRLPPAFGARIGLVDDAGLAVVKRAAITPGMTPRRPRGGLGLPLPPLHERLRRSFARARPLSRRRGDARSHAARRGARRLGRSLPLPARRPGDRRARPRPYTITASHGPTYTLSRRHRSRRSGARRADRRRAARRRGHEELGSPPTSTCTPRRAPTRRVARRARREPRLRRGRPRGGRPITIGSATTRRASARFSRGRIETIAGRRDHLGGHALWGHFNAFPLPLARRRAGRRRPGVLRRDAVPDVRLRARAWRARRPGEPRADAA